MQNRFTCLSFEGDTVVTGDNAGRIIQWSLKSESDYTASHEIIGVVNEEVVEVYRAGFTTLCRTKSGKIYYWTMESVRRGPEVDLRVADCELINTIPCPEYEEEDGHSCTYSYLLSRKLYNPTLEKYWELINIEFINIESGETEQIIESDHEELSNYFYANGFVNLGDYYVTPGGVWGSEPQIKYSEYCTYGAEFELDNSDDFGMGRQWVFSAGTMDKAVFFAFVDDIFPYDESADDEFYYVRLVAIDCADVKREYEFWGETQYQILDPDTEVLSPSTFDFRIKKSEARKISFHQKRLATINNDGAIKVFDIEEKKLLWQLAVPPKPKTNEFGELI